MKTLNITFILFLLKISICYGQVWLSNPYERAVYQRDNSNQADIWVCGQFFTSTKPTTIQYRLVTLSNAGTAVSYSSYTTIPGTDIQNGRIFRHKITPSGGWYNVEVRGLDGSGNLIDSQSAKFGVGEVFIIAGQSNARGEYTDNVNQAIVNPDGFIDCITVKDINYGNCPGTDEFPYPDLTVMNNYTDIGPYGSGNWCYSRLGRKIVDNYNVPVMFFNAALGATFVYDWSQTAAGNTSPGWICNGSPFPYRGLKNTLNLYASLFGIRAIIWHQGEFDSYHAGTSTTDYKNRLEAVIAQSRTDFDSQDIPWVVSKASYYNATTSSNVTTAQSNVVTNSANNPIAYGAQSQDLSTTVSYTNGGVPGTKSNRQSDGNHFSDAGLLYLADDYYSNISSIFSLTPIKAKDTGAISVAVSGSSWTLTASGTSVSSYQWTTNFWNYETATGPTTSTNTSASGWWFCYMRNAKGNFMITQRVSLPLPAPGMRVSQENNVIPMITYPNPLIRDSDLSLNFSLSEDVKNFNITIIDEKGKILKEVTSYSHIKGTYNYTIKDLYELSKENKVIYVKVFMNGYFQTKRIYLDKL